MLNSPKRKWTKRPTAFGRNAHLCNCSKSADSITKNTTMKTVQVQFENSQYNYLTDVSDNATNESIEKYFLNKFFNVSPYPTENMQMCTGADLVEFYFFCGNQKIYVAENCNFYTLPYTKRLGVN
jgi:hypothetical protein